MAAGTYTYATGRALATDEARAYAASRNRAGYLAAREAARDWRRAESQHEETSYWGGEHIRAMRGFWLGVARSIGEGGIPRLTDGRAIAAHHCSCSPFVWPPKCRVHFEGRRS